MKSLKLFLLFSVLLLIPAMSLASDLTVIAPHGGYQPYLDIFNHFGLTATVMDQYPDNLDTVGTVFLVGDYAEDIPPWQFYILASFLEQGGNLYIHNDLLWEAEQDTNSWFFEQYLPIGWVTCETWPFQDFIGRSFFGERNFSFVTSRYGSIMEPYDQQAVEIVLEDTSQFCGCVAAAGTVYNTVVTEHDLYSVEQPLLLFGLILQHFGLVELGVDLENSLPNQNFLFSNYPNPFNSQTSISFYLAENSLVTLDIYNIIGQKMETLLQERMLVGEYTVNWQADDFASGVYFYQLIVGNYRNTRRMVLVK